MHSDSILDSAANLLVCHMVFVGNVQRPHIASHLCINSNVICKAEVGNKLSSKVDTTFMVVQCITRDSF